MKNLIKTISIPTIAACLLVACEKPEYQYTVPDMSVDGFKEHVVYLADDALGGRETGTEGYQMAADYVAKHFKDSGLKPGGDDGTYFQTIRFAKNALDMDNSGVSLTVGDATTSLAIGEDVLLGAPNSPTHQVAGDMVFVGYGLTSEKDGIDDFAGVDVTGKIIVRLWGAPKGKEALANGKSRNGAAGIIELFSPELQTRVGSWDRLKGFVAGARLNWLTPEGNRRNAEQAQFLRMFASPELVNSMLGMTLEEAIAAATTDGFSASTIGSVDIKAASELIDPITSPNVVGILEGSDPVLKDEYVVISAHLDHTGENCANRTGKAQDGDTICNGVMDNAVGISSMIEVVEAFSKKKMKPRRSTIFIALTAEEQGLFGSEYYIEYPTVPREGLVANVNLDMPIINYHFMDLVAIGAENSTIAPIAEASLASVGIALVDDPTPETNSFVRSDQFSFIKAGIPAIFLRPGPTSDKDTVDMPVKERHGYKQQIDFRATHYHNPSDDLNQFIDWEAGAKFGLANYMIIESIAMNDERPLWYEGNRYGDQYAPDAPRAKKPE